MKKSTKLGFSLIELSVVILVIGLLVIGITQGSRIMSSAKLKSARALTTSSPVNSSANLVLWIDSTSDNSFDSNIENNSEITNWYDLGLQSITKHNFTQSTTGQYPLYKVNLFNGLPGVVFDGINDWMSTTHSYELNPNGGGFTLFLVSKVLNTSGLAFYISKGNSNSNALGYSYVGRQFRFRTDDTTNGGGPNTFPSTLPDSTPKIATAVFFGTQARYYKNNTEQTPASSYTGSINSSSNLVLGGRSSGDSNGNVEIYEFIIFNRQLNSTEITNINKYLGQKWGIATS